MTEQSLTSAFAQGSAALRTGDFAAAERIFSNIVEREPGAHDAWLALAVIAMRAGSPDVAVKRASRAVALDPGNALYLNNLGIAEAERGDFAAAEEAIRKALSAKPGYAEAHYNLAKTLHKQGRLDDSLREYEAAHALDPRSVPIQVGLCGMYRLHGRPQRALELLRRIANDRALPPALGPHFAESVADVEGPEAAVAWLREEVARQPNAQPAHHILALLLLGLGDWREGWKEYLWRNHPAPGRSKAVLPERLDGKRVVLRGEQGLGDVLFFLRFAAELRQRGALVSVECEEKLAPLLAERFDLAKGDHPDRIISIGDLPALLQTETVPPPLALPTEEHRRTAARQKLARLGKPPYLGVTWQAGTNVLRRREYGMDMALLFKQIAPDVLGRAIRGWPGTIVSLQRSPAPAELQALQAAVAAPVHDLAAINEDLQDALALLAELHEYVAVSNTNIHLLAGLGRTARVLVPHPPEWRWMRSGNSPWFPGFDVYRQSRTFDWSEALIRLRRDLFAARESPPPARA